jgi:hypothetical protein
LSEDGHTRIVYIADLHCGHRSGLTPPAWQYTVDDDPVRNKFAEVQRVIWDFYVEQMDELQPIDRLVVGGDAIEGKGQGSGGTELITADRKIQVEMAAYAIRDRSKRIAILKGTKYHVGDEEDWEEVLADRVQADHCGAHEWIDAQGVIIDCKHKISGSSIPHGRSTPLARAHLWNLLWAEREMQPKAQIIVRSHVHYHVFTGGAGWVAMTTPALQGWTKFGSLEVEGTNDIGLVVIDVEKGKWSWETRLLDMHFAAAKPLRA